MGRVSWGGRGCNGRVMGFEEEEKDKMGKEMRGEGFVPAETSQSHPLRRGCDRGAGGGRGGGRTW